MAKSSVNSVSKKYANFAYLLKRKLKKNISFKNNFIF